MDILAAMTISSGGFDSEGSGRASYLKNYRFKCAAESERYEPNNAVVAVEFRKE
jgi:hypothetical protein